MNLFASLGSFFSGLFGGNAKSSASADGGLRLYVGNLSFSAKDEDLKGLFSKFGQVIEVSIIRDRFTGKRKGYAFVEMPREAAAKALQLNGSEFLGRKLVVSEAKEKKKESREGQPAQGQGGQQGGGRERGGRRRGGRGRGGQREGTGRSQQGGGRERGGQQPQGPKGKMERFDEDDQAIYN